MAIYPREDPRTALPQLEKKLNEQLQELQKQIDELIKRVEELENA